MGVRMEASMSAKVTGKAAANLQAFDPVWTQLRAEAEDVVQREPALAGFVYTYVLNHEQLEQAVAHRIADRLDSQSLDAAAISNAFAELYEAQPDVSTALRADLVAVYDRD